MSDKIYFEIPHASLLATEDGWTRDPKSKYRYYTFRCHYMLRERQLSEPVRRGEVIDAFTSDAGITQKKTLTVEYEHTDIKIEESVKESLKEEESILEFVSTLSSGLGSDAIGKISNELKSSAQHKLRESFAESFKVGTTLTTRTKKTVSFEYTTNPEKFDPRDMLVAVKAYKRHSYDLYLVYIDYLFVEYKRPLGGIFLKRSKFPEVIGNKHSNIIKVGLPLASIPYWRQLSDTVLILNQKDHKIEVDDPLNIEVKPPRDRLPYAPISPQPTLYELSNRAFSRRRLI